MKVQKFTTIPNSQQYSKMDQPFVGDEKQTPLVQRHVPVKQDNNPASTPSLDLQGQPLHNPHCATHG